MEIHANAVTGGSHVEVFYDAFTKLWYINYNSANTSMPMRPSSTKCQTVALSPKSLSSLGLVQPLLA